MAFAQGVSREPSAAKSQAIRTTHAAIAARTGRQATQAAARLTMSQDTFRASASDDPLAILQDWKTNRGGLWENGFWSDAKIDAPKALELLKKGDDILVRNPFGGKDEAPARTPISTNWPPRPLVAA